MSDYYTLEVELRYVPAAGDGSIGDDLDSVVSHLLDDLAADDLFVILNKERRTVLVSLLVEGSPGEAPETTIGKGLGLIRTALHVTGAITSPWPSSADFHLCAITLKPAAMPVTEKVSEPSKRLASV